MATAEVIVLSSSPSRSLIATTPPPGSVALMSSSPRLPSPSQLMMRKRPDFTTGSRATHVPLGALTGFASAASLLRTSRPAGPNYNAENLGKLGKEERLQISSGGWERAQSRDQETGQGATKAIAKKPKGSRKKAPKDALVGSIIPIGPETVAEPDLSKTAAAKKPRARKSKDESQTKIKRGKVTKPVATSESVQLEKPKGRPRKKNLKIDVENEGIDTSDGVMNAPQDVVPLYLDEAMRRRKDWTPPRDTIHTDTDFPALTEPLTIMYDSAQTAMDEAPSRDLSGLLSNYSYPQGHVDATSDPARLRTSDGEALSKKRRIELVGNISCPPLQPSPAIKPKAPKKKPQTITEKATAPFIAEDAAAVPTLFQYFPASAPLADAGKQNADFANVESPSKPARRKTSAKTPSKAKGKATASKKQTLNVPILLSPESALKKARNQDLLFGTSSQLAREESPSFIRDLQQAIKASELIQEPTPFADSGYIAASAISGSSTGSGMSLHVASRNLWSVAARDTQGLLLDADIIGRLDEVEAPVSLPEDVCEPEMRMPVERERNTATVNLRPEPENFAGLPNEAQSQKPENPIIVDPSLCLQPSIPKSVAEAALRQRPRSRSPVKKGPKSKAQKKNPSKPDFQGFTTSKLTKEIASYGFKPIKNREQMITLLERCCEGRIRMALQSLPPNVNVPSLGPTDADEASVKAPSPPKRKGRPAAVKAVPKYITSEEAPPTKPRGRPRKTPATSAAANPAPKAASKKAAAQADTAPPRPHTPTKAKRNPPPFPPDEISDSDSPLTPSPPRRASPTNPNPLPLTTPHHSQPTPNLSPSAAQARLFSQITEAITTAPPTHDPRHLTWFEKILLFDPIVLEDLAGWLNTEGLGRVGVDREVGAAEVRAWCEARGVCCLWRVNLRGGARARY